VEADCIDHRIAAWQRCRSSLRRALRRHPQEQPPAAAASSPRRREGNYAAKAAPAAHLFSWPGNGCRERRSTDRRFGALDSAGVRGCDADSPQLIDDRRAALERLVISARALADAPIGWSATPAIEPRWPELPRGQVSGVVSHSVTSNARTAAAGPFLLEPRARRRTQGHGQDLGRRAAARHRPPWRALEPLGSHSSTACRPDVPRIIEASIPDRACLPRTAADPQRRPRRSELPSG